MRVIPVTVGDDARKAHLLTESLARLGHEPCVVLGDGEPWKGGTMQGPGGGQKINLMKRWLNSRDDWTDQDLVLFSDGYDTTVHGSPVDFIKKWKWFQAPASSAAPVRGTVVFGAESVNWPGPCTNQPPVSSGRFRFLNSGGYIGPATVLKEMFNSANIEDHEDDQLYCQRLYASGLWPVCLDIRKDIFCCLSDHLKDSSPVNCLSDHRDRRDRRSSGSKREIYHVPETDSYPLQLHGNGVAKKLWRDLISR